MSALLIAFLILLYTLQSFFCKLYSDRYPGEERHSTFVYSLFSGLMIAFFTFAVGGFFFRASSLTLVLALFNSLVLFGYNFFLIRASLCGPYSILMAFSLSGGILIPTFVSLLFLEQQVNPIGWVSIIGIITATYLICNKGKSDTRPTLRFFLLCGGLFLCNGLYGAFLNLQQAKVGEGEREEMIVLTFLFSALLAAAALLVRTKGRVLAPCKQTRVSLLLLLLCGVVSAAAVNTLTFIIPLVDTAILYSFDNAGVLLLSLVCSAIFLREKLKPLNLAGAALMCVSLFCLSWFQ